MGAKYFGATRWGAIGGILGAIVGFFFGLPGLFIGPLAGAIIGELLGGKGVLPAGKSGWGTFLGTTAGMIGKFAIGVIMIGWFTVAALMPIKTKSPGTLRPRGFVVSALLDQSFILIAIASCCSSVHGALSGTSVEFSDDPTRSFASMYCSSSSPLMSGSIWPFTTTQGESGWPLSCSISNR